MKHVGPRSFPSGRQLVFATVAALGLVFSGTVLIYVAVRALIG